MNLVASPDELVALLLVLVRTSVLFALFPVFGDKVVSGPVKILLSIALSVLLFPILKTSGAIQISNAAAWSSSLPQLLMVVASEVLVGLAIGFASQLVFHAMHSAGDIIAQFMGLGMATQYDPHSGNQTMVLGQLIHTLAMLTFLAIDGPNTLIRAMVETFHSIPQGGTWIAASMQSHFVRITGSVLLFAVQLSAPVAGCMVLVNLVYGILGKSLPQLNILTLSMATSVMIGGFVLWISYPSMQSGMTSLFETSFDDLKSLMVAYGGK